MGTRSPVVPSVLGLPGATAGADVAAAEHAAFAKGSNAFGFDR